MGPVVAYLSLILARSGAFVSVLPLLGGTSTPRTVKAGLAVALTLFWGSVFWDQMPVTFWLSQGGGMSWLGFGLALGREILLGLVVGYAFGLFLVPAHVAGEYLTQEMGLSFGGLVSSTGTGQASSLTLIFEMVAGAIFFGLDGHHVFLGVMHGTFLQHPVGGELPTLPVEKLVNGAALTEEWGLMLAAPMAVCLFVTSIVLMFLGRAAPQLNLYSVGFPLRLGAGLAAAFLLWPNVVSTMVNVLGNFGDYLARLF